MFFWIIGIGCISLFLYMAVMNWLVFFNNYIFKKQWTSAIPLVGGIAGILGIILIPVKGFTQFWWLPLLIDWGSLPVIIFSLVYPLLNKGSKTR
jgi:hypothetical protein